MGLSVWIDESEKGDLLVLGALIASWEQVPEVVAGWRAVKRRYGLAADVEVKWNLPSDHETRNAIEENGLSTRALSEALIEFIASTNTRCIAVAMTDKRELSSWRELLWPKASVLDFYCEGLRYILQRVALERVSSDADDCVVVCDTPQLGRRFFQFSSIRRGSVAVQDAYKIWHRAGLGSDRGRQHNNEALADLDFHPSILIGDATYHDMLQLADIVTGATREWVDTVRKGRQVGWEVDQFRALSRKFRQREGYESFFGPGFILWPRDPDLWRELQESLA